MRHTDEYINNIQYKVSAPFTEIFVLCVPLPFFFENKKKENENNGRFSIHNISYKIAV